VKCFIIIPYDPRFLRIYEQGIRQSVEECGMECSLPLKRPVAGPIDESIHRLIREATLCVADLTDGNPNVMYEVALAHSLGKPVILITQGEPERIPFDIRHHHVIHYKETPKGVRELSALIAGSIRATIELGASPLEGLRQMLMPSSLGTPEGAYVVAASPLSYREAFRSRGGWIERPIGTYSDHLGIRGLMRAFGLIGDLDRLPHLVDPDDFDDKVLPNPMHLYCIASPKANRWTGLMMKEFFKDRTPRWEFRADPESTDIRNPRVLLYLDGRAYDPVSRIPGGRLVWDFGLVLRGPHPYDASHLFMALGGRSSLGSEAACLAATDLECLNKLIKSLRDMGIDPDDHRQAFCAIVSVGSKERKSHLGADRSQFRVEDVVAYR